MYFFVASRCNSIPSAYVVIQVYKVQLHIEHLWLLHENFSLQKCLAMRHRAFDTTVLSFLSCVLQCQLSAHQIKRFVQSVFAKWYTNS